LGRPQSYASVAASSSSGSGKWVAEAPPTAAALGKKRNGTGGGNNGGKRNKPEHKGPQNKPKVRPTLALDRYCDACCCDGCDMAAAVACCCLQLEWLITYRSYAQLSPRA